ncbi:hypothetical protein BJ508DRAFT_53231 [Ascobolus immersus RN42]|uniref:C2H2-type domain-containing protein n=1 Tax=Ascobolus immersus RN42 TaxID=1160509 RepID=A0A3N4HK71_ASCIM|nr:hypothetical protein BJ508DRAFT_53231 [Ascobolus immersus RN42]
MSCELAPNGLRNASLTIRDTQNGEKIGILRDLYSIGTDIFTNITFSNELQQLSLQDAELLVRWKNERGRFSIWGRDTSTENGDLDDTFATDPGAGLRKTLLYLLASTVSSLWSILLILDIKKTSKLHTFLQLLDTICSDVDDERWSARITVLADDLVDIQKQMDDIGIDDTDISDVLGDLLEDLKSTNDRLFGLIPAIEQHVKDSNATRIPPGAQAYISNIKDKFSSVSHVLATRLATINWQRHNRIRQQLETGAEEERVKQENKPEKDSALGTSLFTFELALPADVQNPYTKKYASSIVSATSFGTTTSGFSGNAKIPPPPVKLGSKTTFNCTICFKTVTMTENREWKKHVLRDLQPYSCTSDSCPEGDKTFDSRKDWIEHEFSCHRQETSRHWVCFDCGEMEFSDENSLAGHHSTNHRSLSDQATQYRFKPTSLPSKTCCPFCNETISQTKTDVKLHIGRHMDEIALKALPQSFGEIDEEGDDADSNIEDGTRQTLESHFSISMDSTTTIEHKQSHASDRCNPVDFEGVENQNTRESEDSILQPQLFPNDNLDSDASQSSQIPVSQFISKWAGTLAEYNDMQASRGLANGELEPLQSVEAALSGSRSPSPDVYASSLPLAYPFKSIIMDIPAPRHAIFAPNGMKRPPLLPPPRPPPPPPPPPVLHTTGVESAGFRGPSEPSQFLRMPPLGSGIRFESQRNENEIPARLCLRGGSAANEYTGVLTHNDERRERMAESLEKAGCDMETESLEDSSVNPRNLVNFHIRPLIGQ